MTLRTLGVVVIGLLLTPVPATAAPFALESVEVAHLLPDLFTVQSGPFEITAPDSVVVDLTSPGSFGQVRLAVLDSEIVVTALVNSGFEAALFHGFRITDIHHTIPAFTSVTVGGAPSSRVTFDADRIFINLEGVNLGRNAEIRFEVVATDTVVAVPEPSTMALTGLGIAALLTSRRRLLRSRT